MNFWCVVALDYDKDESWILDQSQDARDCDLLDGSAGSDNGLTSGTWVEAAVPGLYRLELSPWGHQSYEGEWDTGIDVTKATLLVAFPERLCDDEGCPHHGTDHVCINRVEKDCEVCGGDCAAANPPVMNCPRDDAKDALRLLWAEVVESGNADSKSYGWPKAAAATRKVLGL